MLFYRYISENLTVSLNKRMVDVGFSSFDYANISDEKAEIACQEMVSIKGVFILPSELFANVCRNAAQDDNLNEALEKIFKHIEESASGSESEDNCRGLFDDMDINSKKLGGTVATRNEKHDVGYDKFDVALGDTLTDSQYWDDAPFQAIVSNPSYAIKWAGEDNPVLTNDSRFAPAGVLAPKSKADLAFILHALSCLSADGTAAIVCFPGVMYRGGQGRKDSQVPHRQ